MVIIDQLRDSWLNFVSGKNKRERKVYIESCEWGSLVFPTQAVSDEEKWEFISQACAILEDEIKIVSKPKVKSKNKSK